jgi:hypothetical protein
VARRGGLLGQRRQARPETCHRKQRYRDNRRPAQSNVA